MIFPFPKWVLEMPEGVKKQRAIDEFYLRLACLYATRQGTARALAELLDINYTTFVSQMSDPRVYINGIPEETCRKVEEVVGLQFGSTEKIRLYG